ncbi:rho GTPase-activating protein 11A isoform 2-T2 [Discoglossus pictus]
MPVVSVYLGSASADIVHIDMKKQSPDYPSLARLAVVQHLRSCGIKIKHWNCKSRPEPERRPTGLLEGAKVFGTPLHLLPQKYVPDYGMIPKFLVDVCKYLELHAHTEGLFRKSGSVVRLKLLKTKLDTHEDCLLDSPPCDVAGILKQFFRELPEPILHPDLQDALFKAQNLGSDEDKAFATVLICCLIPDRTIHILRYFLNFLHAVSMRSDLNRMDSSNLALIFAPNLLQANEDSEKVSSSTEKKMRIQAAIVRTLIDQAADIGCVPNFLLEKIPGMLGVDEDAGLPGTEIPEDGEGDSPGERKRRRRRSVGVFSSMVTPLILTPSTKRKLPVDSAQGISSKKRKAIKHNLTFDLLPNSLFGSTPASASYSGSPSLSLETTQNPLSPLVSSGSLLSSSGNLRRSKRSDNRKVQRVESGKTGCFSPKITRKEMVRRSLRLRFSLGKSSKDSSAASVFPSSSRSQNIGWRLANSQELIFTTSENTKVDDAPPPAASPFVSAGSKKISKSEENLLTPKQPDGTSQRLSWTGPCLLDMNRSDEDSPITGCLCVTNYYSEPLLVSGKPPVMPQEQRSSIRSYRQDTNMNNDSLCEEGENQAQYTVMKITQAFSESGSDLHKVVEGRILPEKHTSKTVTNSQLESDRQVRLKETNQLFDNPDEDKLPYMEVRKEHIMENGTMNSLVQPLTGASVVKEQINLIITEDSKPNPSIRVCSMEIIPNMAATEEETDKIKPVLPSVPQENVFSVSQDVVGLESFSCEPSSRHRRSSRVSDHINHFNKLSLNDRNSSHMLKSPLKFQRTPVRQSIRRMNSLSGVKKQVAIAEMTSSTTGRPVTKSLSYDGSLSSALLVKHSTSRSFSTSNQEISVSHRSLALGSLPEADEQKPNQPLRNRGWSTTSMTNPMKSVLEDLTNQNIKGAPCRKLDLCASTPNISSVSRVSGRDRVRYKGSPKNPITRVALMPSTKPLEL